MQTHTNSFDSFSVGDPVHWPAGSDTKAGTVVRLTKTQVIVRAVPATLLNPVGSDAPDALQFHAGGFVGHTSGQQRYAFGEPEGSEIVFSRRVYDSHYNNDDKRRDEPVTVSIAKLKGTSMSGSMSSWGRLRHGHAAHYDFNF
tara:strand:- start:193 stop:621 length:429 start_codon:yes stop_codon:yes gene_type:complete